MLLLPPVYPNDSDSFQLMALPFLGAPACKVQDGTCAFLLVEGGKKRGDTTFSATEMTQKLFISLAYMMSHWPKIGYKND